jgi:hypothetical protein
MINGGKKKSMYIFEAVRTGKDNVKMHLGPLAELSHLNCIPGRPH